MAHIRGPVQTRKGPAFDVCWRDPDGAFRQERVYGKKPAIARAKQIDTTKHEGKYVDDRKGKVLFGDVAEEWVSQLTNPRPETINGYRALLRLHVYPTFADRPIRAIKPSDLRKWINELKLKPGNENNTTLHPTTIKKALGVAKSVLRYAVAEGIILKSPATDEVKPPTIDTMGLEPFEGRALTLAQVETVASICDDVSPVYGLAVRFLAATGLRASELSGLQIGDVSAGKVEIRRTATRDGQADDGIRYGRPKSKTSRRDVPILDQVIVDEFAAFLDRHPQCHDPNAPVFPSRKPGGNHRDFDWERPIDTMSFRRYVFAPACVQAGLGGKVRLHDLRHTAGTLWLAADVSLFRVSRYLGHKSAEFTARIYGHVLEQSAVEDMAKFAAYRRALHTGNVLPFRAAR